MKQRQTPVVRRKTSSTRVYNPEQIAIRQSATIDVSTNERRALPEHATNQLTDASRPYPMRRRIPSEETIGSCRDAGAVRVHRCCPGEDVRSAGCVFVQLW